MKKLQVLPARNLNEETIDRANLKDLKTLAVVGYGGSRAKK